MARGEKSPTGAMRQAKNRYWYIKLDSGWKLMHHHIMETKLGRELRKGRERVVFKDGNRNDYDIDNLELVETKAPRLGRLEFRMKLLMEQAEKLQEDIARAKAKDGALD